MSNEEAVIVVYGILGILLWGVFRSGSSGARTMYGIIFPVHLVILHQVGWVRNWIWGVEAQRWYDILMWAGILLFVALAV